MNFLDSLALFVSLSITYIKKALCFSGCCLRNVYYMWDPGLWVLHTLSHWILKINLLSGGYLSNI